MRTKAGLKVFSRERIGLRKPTGPTSRQDAICGVSIHHGGAVGRPRMTFKAAAQTCREWQAFHQNTRGWSDIGYTFLVDGLGRLYEGRPVHTVPAAVAGHNTGTIGICFVQDGSLHGLTVLQRRTLRILFEKGIPELDVPPLKTLDVRGHNEYRGHETNACPGRKIMRHLAWRRRQYR